MKKLLLLLVAISLWGCSSTPSQTNNDIQEDTPKEEIKQVEKTTITLNFVGDITLGNFAGMSYDRSFDQLYAKKKDKSYFLKNVKSVFADDDLTIGNLEGPLTSATSHMDKKYAFKGKKEYAGILSEGNIDIVSLANNHSSDYYEKGKKDTQESLKKENIDYFGYERKLIKEVKGKKIGFIGFSFAGQIPIPSHIKEQATKAIQSIKDETDLIVVYYHWGEMYEYAPRKAQVEFAHYTIDQGADLVVGTHAHVIQGIETYKGKNIVYSLGNFCYGGNKNPKDIDSMIFQQTFSFEDDKLVDTSYKAIAATWSSDSNSKKNNFQPQILKGSQKETWEKRVKKYSKQIPEV